MGRLRLAGMIVTVLRQARAGAPPDSSAKVQVLVPSPTERNKEMWTRYFKALNENNQIY